MRTAPDCLPCFFRQALTAARLACPDAVEVHERVLQKLGALVANFDIRLPPPVLAGRLYAMLRNVTGVDDCFYEEKKCANQRALELLPALEEKVRRSEDPLATALEISIIGNYIDAGVEKTFDWEKEMHSVGGMLIPDCLDRFRRKAVAGAHVLMVGDNAGEIGFDRLLVSELLALGTHVTYAVRGRPILNDATLEDAREVGMNHLCEVVSSGVDTPGAVLERCTPQFLQLLQGADLVLAKGQGNYESLTESGISVYFAFKVKCPVVASRTGLTEASSVFLFES